MIYFYLLFALPGSSTGPSPKPTGSIRSQASTSRQTSGRSQAPESFRAPERQASTGSTRSSRDLNRPLLKAKTSEPSKPISFWAKAVTIAKSQAYKSAIESIKTEFPGVNAVELGTTFLSKYAKDKATYKNILQQAIAVQKPSKESLKDITNELMANKDRLSQLSPEVALKTIDRHLNSKLELKDTDFNTNKLDKFSPVFWTSKYANSLYKEILDFKKTEGGKEQSIQNLFEQATKYFHEFKNGETKSTLTEHLSATFKPTKESVLPVTRPTANSLAKQRGKVTTKPTTNGWRS